MVLENETIKLNLAQDLATQVFTLVFLSQKHHPNNSKTKNKLPPIQLHLT